CLTSLIFQQYSNGFNDEFKRTMLTVKFLARSFDGCFKFYSSSVPVQAAGKRAVLPLMGDALQAFSSPFKPANKQLRKLS
ncbi:unnamed protein product, partial [Porites evermanni]